MDPPYRRPGGYTSLTGTALNESTTSSLSLSLFWFFVALRSACVRASEHDVCLRPWLFDVLLLLCFFWLLETALTFLKNVREIFGKADGRTSNCPRCQGSGMLTNRSGWGCGQVLPISNDFCWFCEGIWVIPIIGLSGFMLGRSTPILNTKKMKQHSHLPVNIQLYNGKYPGSKCKLTSYKPSTYGISELLSDQPDYLGALENGNNLVEEESSPMETAEDISVPGEDFQKIPFWTTLSAGNSHHLRFYARTSTSLSFHDLSASLHSSAPYVNFEASGVKPTSADMRMIVNMGGSAFHSTTSSIMRNLVSMLVHGNEPSGKPPAGKGDGTGDGSGKFKHHKLRDPSDCIQRQTRIRIEVSDHQCAALMSITDTSQSDVQGAESGNFSTSEGPLLSNLWGPHSLRRVRNWIREKAQKEAKEKPKSFRSCSLRDMME